MSVNKESREGVSLRFLQETKSSRKMSFESKIGSCETSAYVVFSCLHPGYLRPDSEKHF